MKTKSLANNVLLNIFKMCCSILFPLITYPYAARILSAEGLGRVNYSQAIVNYFALLAALGVSYYAVREGAKFRDDKEKLNTFANEIFSINLITTVVAYGLLIGMLLVVKELKKYEYLIFLQSISILLTTIGVDWLNTLYEDYFYITVRSIVIQICSLIALFLVVRDAGDYYWYASINVVSNAIVCVLNFFYCRKYAAIRFVRKMNFKKHIRPLLILFANSVTITIYVNSDITMLGFFVGDHSVGVYSMAVKMYDVAKRILVALYVVIIPRLSYYWGKGSRKKFGMLYSQMLNMITIILIPISVGMMFMSKEIIGIIGGIQYEEAILPLQILCGGLIFAIWGGMFTNCLNIPLGREICNMRATVLSAVLNVGLNIIVIPIFKQNGAAFTTLLSEWGVFIYCVLTLKENTDLVEWKTYGRNLRHALIGCVGMALYVMIIKCTFANIYIKMLVSASGGAIVYVVILHILRNETLLIIQESVKSKIRQLF